MDSLEIASPSKSYQSSLGLLDENLIDEASFGNKSQELKNNFLKPPTSFKSKPENLINKNDSNNDDENVADNPEVTVNNVVINDSELNDLENEFTFSDDNDTNETNDSDKNLKEFDFKSSDFDAQSKIAAFLSSDNDYDNPRRSRELSCIHEEDHDLNQTATNKLGDYEEEIEKHIQEVNRSVNKDATLLETKNDFNDNKNDRANLTASINLSDLSSCYSIEKAKEMCFDDPVLMTTPTPIMNTKASKLNPAIITNNKNDINEDSRNDCLSSFNCLNNTSRNMDFTLQNNSPQVNSSKQYDASLSSIYFKPANDILSAKSRNDSIASNDTFRLSNKFDHNFSQNIANGTLDKMFENKGTNDVDTYGFGDSSMNGALQQALFNEQQLGISMGEFKSGEELLNEFDMMQTTRDIDEQSWWNVNGQQPSKLDLSNMTTTSAASSLSTTSATTSSDKKSIKNGNTVAVDDYFTRKSCLPTYLIDDHKSLLNLSKEFSAHDQSSGTIVAQKMDNKSKLNTENSVCVPDKSNLTDFTFSMPTVTHIDNCFSFTLNSSDNGDFIQRLDKNKPENNSDNINSTLKHESAGVKPPTLSTKPINTNSINIKEIGEDLNRISNLLSNRLALNENKIKVPEKPIINDSLQKSNISTISKDTNAKTKAKLTGSITSTPAKVQTVSTTSTITTTKLSSSATNTDIQQNNHLFNQESFISSIPDRNDTDSDATVTSCDSDLNNKNFKKPLNVKCNAEIQTSPLKQNDNNEKFSNGFNSANTTTTSLSSIISSAAAAAAANAVNSSSLNGVIPVAFLPIQALLPCMQKLYDDSQATSILTQTLSKMFSQSQLQQQQQSSQQMLKDNLFDYDNLSQLSKQLQFQQQRQKNCDLLNPNLPDRDFSGLDNRLSLNSQAGVGTQRNQIPLVTAQVPPPPPQPMRLPQIEVDKYVLDFNYIAEGCHDVRSFLLKEILNPTPVIYGSNYYVLVEINETRFQINKNTTTLTDNELKLRLSKIFSLSLKASSTPSNYQRSNFIKLDTSSGKLFEINFHVDTVDLNLYKELFNLDKQRKYKPFEINLGLSISCCVENQKGYSQQQQPPKYLLNQIDIKLILGYARLKTNANTADTIDFIVEKRIDKNRIDYVIDELNKEKVIPVSNGGNVPINVKCYLDDESINNNLANYCININSEIVNLDEFGTNKSLIIKLLKKTSNKLESTLNDEEQQNEANLSTRLIIEVLPNGPKYQIPLQLKLKEVQVENANSTLTTSTSKSKLQKSSSVTSNLSSTSLRILSSKSIIQFSPCEVNDYLVEDLVLMNPNEFNVKCTISISTLNEQQQKSSENMFSFDADADSKNVSTQIVELKSNQSSSFKIRFEPIHQINNSSSLISGLVKISALNYDLNFIVRLVGFVGRANLFVDNLIKQAHINALTKIKYSLKDSLISSSQKYKLNMNPSARSVQRSKHCFSKEIILKNLSTNTKCFFTILCLDKTFTKKIDHSTLKLNLDENYMILNENENYVLNIDFESNDKSINLIENNKLTLNLFVLWTGFDAFLYCYQLLQQNLRMKPANDITVDDNEDEFDLDKFILTMILLRNYNFQSNENQQNISIVSNISSTSQSPLCSLNLANDSIYSQIIKKSKLSKDDLIKYFKSLLNYSIITLVCDFDSQNKPVISQQTKIANEQLPDILFRKAPINVLKTQRYSLSNESIVNNENNNTNNHKLAYSSSCSNLGDINNASRCSINFDAVDTINNTTSLQSIDHLLDFTLNKTNDESIFKNDESSKTKAVTSEVASTTTPSIANSNGWSISPTEINLFINENNIYKQQATILLINSLNKELAYDLIYRRVCLNIEPNKGVLSAKGQIKIVVKINKDVLSKLPWLGTISILCNKTQKDIRVSINHTSAAVQKLPPLPTAVTSNSNNNSRANTNISNANITSLTNTSMKNSTTLEQGTLLSDISQHSLDTLSLTPLINASFMQASGNQFNNVSTMSNKTFKQQTNNEFLLSNNSKMLNDSKQPKSNIKIVRIGSDAHITFPNVSVGSSASAELTLSNPTKNYVRWKSYSTAPAFIRLNDSDLTANESISTSEQKLQILQQSSLYKSSYSVFLISPTSGVIPPSQKQVIKIEFCPREASGLFTQYWEIDTRTDSFDQSSVSEKSFADSYNCKLVLNGQAVSNASTSTQPDARVLANKENLLGNKGTLSQNTEKLNNLSKYSNKENSSVLQSTLQPPKNKIYLENEVLEFGNVEPGESNKASLHIKNVENRTCTLQIMKLLEPFHCKYTSITVKPKHYIRIPIEFKPLLPGDYVDKLLVRVDSSDTPLSCILKAKCIKLN